MSLIYVNYWNEQPLRQFLRAFIGNGLFAGVCMKTLICLSASTNKIRWMILRTWLYCGKHKLFLFAILMIKIKLYSLSKIQIINLDRSIENMTTLLDSSMIKGI